MPETEFVITTMPCIVCGERSKVSVSTGQHQKLLSGDRPHIQDIFPDWDSGKRELLITGTHPECWNKIFGSDEDDEMDWQGQ